MLKPTYFDGAQTDLIESYYEKLENWLMNDIAQRLLKAGEMSGTADRNIWLLEQLGLQKAEINTKLSQLTKMSDKELKAILEDAVLTSWKDDASTMAKLGKTITSPLKNERYMQVINAEFQKCKNDLSNLTNTTMDTAQSDLMRMLNEAEMRVATGSQSYSGAVCEIMDEYAKKGIQVGYPTVSFHNDAGDVMRVTSTRSLESAIQTALRTSMNQTAAQVTNQYINDNGIEYVLVSAHLGARHSKRHPESLESHDWWQGKVFKIRGSEEGYPNLLESTGYDIDPVTGTGMVVNPLGLHGYNCRHSHQPWDKDLKNPWIDENGNAVINQKESQEVYEKQQTQRSMERSIRSTKRQLLVKQTEINGVAETDVKSILQPQYDQLAYKLRKQNQAYEQFCQNNSLNKQTDRTKVIGFMRQHSIKARDRATVYENMLNKNVAQKRIASPISLSKEDFEKLKLEPVTDKSMKNEVLDRIYEELKARNALKTYEKVEIISKDSLDAFITSVDEFGGWCNSTLQINKEILGGRTVEEIDKIFKNANGTKCNSLKEAIAHETYHSRLADKVKYSEYDRLDNSIGDSSISTTAAKDELETIAEIGVLYERGEYDTVKEESKKLFERYFEVK